jgi:hypothetical protein
MATRGRKPQSDAKRKLVVMRCQDVEFNAIEKYAKQLGKPVSTFIRELTLSHLESEGVPTSIVQDNPNQLKIDTD